MMSNDKTFQNTSHAVMAQRAEPSDSLDDFPTPPWAVRAFCSALKDVADVGGTVWEPSANRGYMAYGLQEYFDTVIASDVHDYGAGFSVYDFINDPNSPLDPAGGWCHRFHPFKDEKYEKPCINWIITNPPFRLAHKFVTAAIDKRDPVNGIAVLVRSVWAEGQKRYEELFESYPPSFIFQYSERVPMVKGKYDPDASTATAYSWFVWLFGEHEYEEETIFRWIPPCKNIFYRHGDAVMSGGLQANVISKLEGVEFDFS
jgi:hypothetical protein